MSENNQAPFDDEISIKDMIDFLLETWQVMGAFAVAGIAVALTYIFTAPPQYEAKAQIKMAQISASNNVNPLGVNIEEPALLIARMKLPTTYNQVTIERCGLESEKDPFNTLSELVKISAVKGVAQVVDLTVRAEKPEVAQACVLAVFELIRETQKAIATPFIIESKTKLAEYQKRLDESKTVMLRADKSGAALSAAYLATRDEVKFLTDEVIRLQDFITSGDTRMTQLTAPIYSMKHPVSPKKGLSLGMGLLVGLMVGFFYVVLRKALKKIYPST